MKTPFANKWRAGLYLAMGILLGFSLYMRLSLPDLPFFAPDSVGYLLPGLHWIEQGEFMPAHSRNIAYPFFVGCLLKLGGLPAVALVQHLLTLILCGMVFHGWMRLASGTNTFRGIVYGVSALVSLAVYLIPQQAMWYEHYLGPEGMFSALFLGLICMVLCYSNLKGSKQHALWMGTFIFLQLLTLQVMSKWILALPIMVGGLALLHPRGWKYWRSQLVGGVTGLVVAYITLMLPNNQLQRKYDPEASSFLPQVLFFFHLDLILPELPSFDASPLDANKHSSVTAYLTRALEVEKIRLANDATTHFQKYSYNPDSFYYGDAAVYLKGQFQGDTAAYNAYCKSAFLYTIQRRPFAYAGKVFRQMTLAYRCPAILFPRQLKARWHTPERYRQIADDLFQVMPEPVQQGELLTEAKAKLDTLEASERSVFGPFLFRKFNGVLGAMNLLFLPSLIGFVGWWIIGVWRQGYRVLCDDPMVLMVGLCWLAGFGINLAVCMTHILEFDRYRHFQLIINALAIGGTWLLIVSACAGKRVLQKQVE